MVCSASIRCDKLSSLARVVRCAALRQATRTGSGHGLTDTVARILRSAWRCIEVDLSRASVSLCLPATGIAADRLVARPGHCTRSKNRHEDTVLDKPFGEFVNHDLAEYHVQSHADIPAISVFFLPEVDDKANPLKRFRSKWPIQPTGAGAGSY